MTEISDEARALCVKVLGTPEGYAEVEGDSSLPLYHGPTCPDCILIQMALDKASAEERQRCIEIACRLSDDRVRAELIARAIEARP